jgi:hypothetical protein
MGGDDLPGRLILEIARPEAVEQHDCHPGLLELAALPNGLSGVLDAARTQGVTRFLGVSIYLEDCRNS